MEAPEGVGLRLLLDEMYAPAVARQLRQREHDAVAVGERPDLRGLPDRTLFAAAAVERRALVTENARDFMILASELVETSAHFGLVLTSAKRFPRHEAGTGALVRALESLLRAHPREAALRGAVIWL